MQITNRENLPVPLVSAVSVVRKPRPGQISVTELISPPQIRALTNRYWDAITEDASGRIWATMGSLMHQLLAAHGRMESHQTERTLSTMIEGITVTGTFDLYQEAGTLSDYKFVSVYTTMRGISPEWVQQLNAYAELLRRDGVTVERLQIVAIYRDWNKNKSYEWSYPNSQVQVFDVLLWTSERATAFLTERVRLHLAADEGEIAECSASERWERPTKFALMKRGQKKAVKLYDDPRAADEAITKSDHYVEHRPGMNVRCESYCRVAAFCPQYARLKETREETSDSQDRMLPPPTDNSSTTGREARQ